jgi:hypothetical protein
MNIKNSLFFALMLIVCSCSIFSSDQQKDPILDNEQDSMLKNPNNAVDANKRAQDYRNNNPLLDFGSNKKNQNTTFSFATSNVLWRATLKTLDFIPLASADYAGGILVFDWYSPNSNTNEQLKITVRFLSNELRSDSLQVSAYKKICVNEKCTNVKADNNFTDQINDSILTAARTLKLQEAKTQKN